jgi:hypothetical protein
LLDRKEVTGQMAHGENFAGNLEIPEPELPRRAETPVDLRGLENCGMQLRIILLQLRELHFHFGRRPGFGAAPGYGSIDCTPGCGC